MEVLVLSTLDWRMGADRRSYDNGGNRVASPARPLSGSGCARHTEYDEYAHIQVRMQLLWKKCMHVGSTRTTSPPSSSCRHRQNCIELS
ncbi:hypothetical protein ZWY2020_007186 [Hordeum vulgare]|nr:hypothetical protein ZWY2020_007186 [Hordeum vulgare]